MPSLANVLEQTMDGKAYNLIISLVKLSWSGQDSFVPFTFEQLTNTDGNAKKNPSKTDQRQPL